MSGGSDSSLCSNMSQARSHKTLAGFETDNIETIMMILEVWRMRLDYETRGCRTLVERSHSLPKESRPDRRPARRESFNRIGHHAHGHEAWRGSQNKPGQTSVYVG